MPGCSVGWKCLADAADEGCGIELGAKDFVGAVGMDSDAPVADEGNELAVLGGLDLGTETLGVMETGLALDVDEDEVEVAGPEEGEGLVDVAGGIHFEAGDTEDLIAKRAEHLALAEVEDLLLFRFRAWRSDGHGVLRTWVQYGAIPVDGRTGMFRSRVSQVYRESESEGKRAPALAQEGLTRGPGRRVLRSTAARGGQGARS